MATFIDLGIFAAKALIIILCILLILGGFLLLIAAIAKGKDKSKGKLTIKNLNRKYETTKQELLEVALPKKEFKNYLKEKKSALKKISSNETKPSVYVLNFHGDIKASSVPALTEEINALLSIAKPQDEVVIKLESAGGVVHGYGLGAAQLMRLRAKNIRLTVMIDKVAASGGYLMACVADKIAAAPFAIIGSIGVIVQLPNFNRLLKEKNIDFEQFTAGEFKRTITLFGENTEEGRAKLREEIEEVHQLFKNAILANRKNLDIEKVATGEHWLGQQALGLGLIDEIKTSDDYILERTKDANVYEIHFEAKKPLLAKLLSGGAQESLRALPLELI